MSISKKALIDLIESIAPKALMEPWDNTGIQINVGCDSVEKILVCLDVNHGTILEAIEKGCSFIVSHHPIFFESLKMISQDTLPGKYAIQLIESGISVYSSHTSFDAAPGGNNDYLAARLNLNQISTPENETIMRTGLFPKALPMWEICNFVAEKLGHIYPIKYAGDENKLIHKAAVCSGSGGSLLQMAKMQNCDLLITGDLKYHDALFAQETGINVIDAGHFETEILFIQNMGGQLERALSGSAKVIFSSIEENTLKTLRHMV